jgi:hypothetical protein
MHYALVREGSPQAGPTGGAAIGHETMVAQVKPEVRAPSAIARSRPEGGSMKKQVLKILSTLSLFVVLAVGSVYAQSDLRLKVNIPFEFSVGNETLPAGEYTVRQMFQGVLMIQNEDRSATKIFSTIGAKARNIPNESSLVFHRYGDEYFLSKIWITGNETGREAFKSRAEKELIRARSNLAKSATEHQTVSLVAHH